jgi:hypothetical protein
MPPRAHDFAGLRAPAVRFRTSFCWRLTAEHYITWGQPSSDHGHGTRPAQFPRPSSSGCSLRTHARQFAADKEEHAGIPACQCTRHAVDKPRHRLSPSAADALQKPLVQCKVIQAQELLGARVHPAQGRKDQRYELAVRCSCCLAVHCVLGLLADALVETTHMGILAHICVGSRAER